MKLSRLAAVFAFSLSAAGADSSLVGASEPVMEAATLHSLGMHWVVPDEEAREIEIRVTWRKGDGEWKDGAPLFRVEKRASKPEKSSGSVDVAADATLFSGSLLSLEPGTDYEVKLKMSGGSNKEHILSGRTLAEPVVPKDAVVYYVVPGNGGGTGTEADPFRGLQTAQVSLAR